MFEASGLETLQQQGIHLIRIDAAGAVIVEHSIHQLDPALEHLWTELDVVGDVDGFHQNSVRIERYKLLDAVSRNQNDAEMSAGFGLKEDITEIEVKSIEAEGNDGFSSNAMLEKSIHLQTEWNVVGIASSMKQHAAIALNGETNNVNRSSDLQYPVQRPRRQLDDLLGEPKCAE